MIAKNTERSRLRREREVRNAKRKGCSDSFSCEEKMLFLSLWRVPLRRRRTPELVVLPLVGQVWVVLPAVVFLLPPLGLRLAYQALFVVLVALPLG